MGFTYKAIGTNEKALVLLFCIKKHMNQRKSKGSNVTENTNQQKSNGYIVKTRRTNENTVSSMRKA